MKFSSNYAAVFSDVSLTNPLWRSQCLLFRVYPCMVCLLYLVLTL